jgi:hypothetical protein
MLAGTDEGVLTMLKRFAALVLPLVIVCAASFSVGGPKHQVRNRAFKNIKSGWVMEAIKPGMTRNDLLKVFTTGLHRTFVNRNCAFFKADVEFEAVGRQSRDNDGRVTLEEDPRDVIVKISRPYLQSSIAD